MHEFLGQFRAHPVRTILGILRLVGGLGLLQQFGNLVLQPD